MILSWVLLIAGFVLLVWGADRFVEGAAAAARKMGVPPLLVGLTIVAFGTSAPELAVSVTAALQGANGIALGNVIGSNIFNLLIVAGASAVVCPLVLDKTLMRRDWPLSVAAAGLMMLLMALGSEVSRIDGLILLACFVGLMVLEIRPALKNRDLSAQPIDTPVMKTSMIVLNILIGLACIVGGSQIAVSGATDIAAFFGMSDRLIGLTVVAFGTSLPELVTSIAAARRKENDIAMGNVIGSNLFNILLILGASAAVHPIALQWDSVIDGAVLLAVSILFYLPARKGKLPRWAGAAMLATYAGYLTYLIVR